MLGYEKELSEVFAELSKCDDELGKYVQMANEESRDNSRDNYSA